MENKDILIENKSADRYALDTEDLKLFCKHNNLHFNLIIGFENLKNDTPLFTYIHSGIKKDEYNNGITNHWLILLPHNLIFDSYGEKLKPKMKLPQSFEFTNNMRYQDFNTNVCGAYCSAVYYFLKNLYKPNENGVFNESDFFEQFDNFFEFTKNFKNNDTIIQKWWNQQMKPVEQKIEQKQSNNNEKMDE